MCLGQQDKADLKKPLRKSENNQLLKDVIFEAISRKPKGHDFVIERKKNESFVPRHMNVTGGWNGNSVKTLWIIQNIEW